MCKEGAATSSSSSLISQIIQQVSSSPATVKSEQRDEPTMDFVERVQIIEQLLTSNPGLFLEKFGAYLREQDLCYFEDLDSEDYTLKFHIEQNKKRLADTKNILVKNRRYAALRKLVTEGSYFGETEMKSRNPLLYDQLIGQHMSDEETIERDTANFQNMTLATFLMARFDKRDEHDLHKEQLDMEDSVMEEVEEDSDEEEEPPGPKPELEEDERALLRQEFVTQMYNSFLQGKDKDFDYNSVDCNAEYDDINTKERDEEDTYFDSETPETIHRSASIGAVSANSEEDELDAFMKTLPPTEKQVDV